MRSPEETEQWLDVNVGPKHAEEQVALVEVRIVPGSRMTVEKVIDYTYAELGPWGPDVAMRVVKP
jgi:hypothetical protein